MNISPAGLHLIASFEGWSAVCYDDGGRPGVGNCTIGFGHLVHIGPTTEADRARWGTMSLAHGYALLASDTAWYASQVTKAVHVKLSLYPAWAQARFDCLCSLAFNIGPSAFTSSGLVREINAKGAPRDWAPLLPFWIAWEWAAGRPELLTRRQHEFRCFLAGKIT